MTHKFQKWPIDFQGNGPMAQGTFSPSWPLHNNYANKMATQIKLTLEGPRISLSITKWYHATRTINILSDNHNAKKKRMELKLQLVTYGTSSY